MSAAASLGTDNEYCFRSEIEKPASRLDKLFLQAAARDLMPDLKSLHNCNSTVLRRADGVEVWAGKSSAYFRGLMQCGSVWVCPVCAAKISEVRKKKLQLAIDNAMEYGHGVSLVTLTVRHGRDMPLGDLLEKFTKAVRRLKSGRAYCALQHTFGILGEVRALEVTHGEANGWHPHTHALTFSHAPLKGHALTRLKRRLFVLWYQACEKEGLPLPTYRRGVDVRPAKYAADYVAKWGFASELVKSAGKIAKLSGRNPWQILKDAGAGDKRSAWLFREYAENFMGRRQLFWTPGLSLRLSLGEKQITDQEALDLPEDETSTMLTVIDLDTWAVVLRAGARAGVLHAASEGRTALFGFLNRLRCEVPLWNGRMLGVKEGWEC